VHQVVPALLDIENLNQFQGASTTNASNIYLEGTGLSQFPGSAGIENPIGETRIITTLGNIISQPPAGDESIIRTGTLGDPFAPVLPQDFQYIGSGDFSGSVTFTAGGTNPATIKRNDGGNWNMDGFSVGGLIKVTNNQDNAGAYEIAGISADGLTLT